MPVTKKLFVLTGAALLLLVVAPAGIAFLAAFVAALPFLTLGLWLAARMLLNRRRASRDAAEAVSSNQASGPPRERF